MFHKIENTFIYFAYGSNLLKNRIKINNPSATFLGIGRLDAHQLNFITFSPNWNGASATIVPTPSSHVWGAIWRIKDEDMPALDRQEGVDTNWYFPKKVEVVLPDDSKVECRTYEQTINPPVMETGAYKDMPEERRPSITYLDVILRGAIECNFPKYYINELKKIPHNGKTAPPHMLEKLSAMNSCSCE